MIGALGATLPSPAASVWYLGPIPLRAYALSILAGIIAAAWLTTKRWIARGGTADDVLEITFWAVPFGIVGGRLYHLVTTPGPYWGPDGDPMKAFAIWEGGLGIWGAIGLGAVGAYLGCRRQKVRFPAFADALAPGLLLAQAVGRVGNWFNQELFGGPTDLPWALEVSDAVAVAAGYPPGTTFHPTFLYEIVWNLVGVILLIAVDRRWQLGHGRVFWLYVLYYTLGRLWIESLRIDPAELIGGLRLNIWTSILCAVVALTAFVVTGQRHPGREDSVQLGVVPVATQPASIAGSDPIKEADQLSKEADQLSTTSSTEGDKPTQQRPAEE